MLQQGARRRSLVGIVLLVATVVALAACAAPPTATESVAATQSSDAPEASEDENITLTVWYWGEQEAPGLKDFMDEAARLYTEEHPNIEVKTVLQGEDLRVAFRAAAEAKQGPDIQYFWGGVWTLEDAWLGNLVPISDYWSEEEIAHLPIGQRAESFWDGKQWGMPFYQIGTFWVYNKKLFAEAGLDPETPPATWDELLTACGKLKAKGITPIGMGLKDGQFGGWLISYFGAQNLDSIEDLLAAIRGDQDFTEKKHAEWWVRLDELIQRTAEEARTRICAHPKRVLLLPPDVTRMHSGVGRLTEGLYHQFAEEAEVHVIPTLGQHVPHTPEQNREMFGAIPNERIHAHHWVETCVELGEIPADFVHRITQGAADWAMPIVLNRMLMEGAWDLVINVGHVVPHEVLGFANHNKNYFIGVGGKITICTSHMAAACCGLLCGTFGSIFIPFLNVQAFFPNSLTLCLADILNTANFVLDDAVYQRLVIASPPEPVRHRRQPPYTIQYGDPAPQPREVPF